MIEIKQPGERLVFRYDFADKLDGRVIASIVSIVSQPRGAGANMTYDGEGHTDTAVACEWIGGADGETYLTTVVVEDDSGQNHEIDGEIAVVDLKFTVPLGITSTYLTAEEYIARFGLDETVRLTDQAGTGTVGEALGKALTSAASRIEASLRTRYTLPLAEAPELLKDIAADLARERLHTLYPTPEVTARADRARADLKDIAAGKLELVVDAEAVEEDAGDLPTVYAPDTIFTDSLLSSYRGRMQ
jgi:phage gp36-like protein